MPVLEELLCMKRFPCMPWFMKLLPLISHTLADSLFFSSTTAVKSDLWLQLIRHCPVVLSELSVLWNMCFLLSLYRINYRTVNMQYEVMSQFVPCPSLTHTAGCHFRTASIRQRSVASLQSALCLRRSLGFIRAMVCVLLLLLLRSLCIRV